MTSSQTLELHVYKRCICIAIGLGALHNLFTEQYVLSYSHDCNSVGLERRKTGNMAQKSTNFSKLISISSGANSAKSQTLLVSKDRETFGSPPNVGC